jgi:hypothetical protein
LPHIAIDKIIEEGASAIAVFAGGFWGVIVILAWLGEADIPWTILGLFVDKAIYRPDARSVRRWKSRASLAKSQDSCLGKTVLLRKALKSGFSKAEKRARLVCTQKNKSTVAMECRVGLVDFSNFFISPRRSPCRMNR